MAEGFWDTLVGAVGGIGSSPVASKVLDLVKAAGGNAPGDADINQLTGTATSVNKLILQVSSALSQQRGSLGDAGGAIIREQADAAITHGRVAINMLTAAANTARGLQRNALTLSITVSQLSDYLGAKNAALELAQTASRELAAVFSSIQSAVPSTSRVSQVTQAAKEVAASTQAQAGEVFKKIGETTVGGASFLTDNWKWLAGAAVLLYTLPFLTQMARLKNPARRGRK